MLTAKHFEVKNTEANIGKILSELFKQDKLTAQSIKEILLQYKITENDNQKTNKKDN